MKPLVILFFVCFGLYVWFSRQPDYFDGQFTTGIIHFAEDSAAKKIIPRATYTLVDKGVFSINADYLFNDFKEGEKVKIIYDTAKPENAAVYSVWGYWINWKEVLACIAGYILLYYGALKITQNPSAEALKELEEETKNPRRKRFKYDV
ncbi:MAG: hypothetical protein LBE82_13335 [Chitinophagaceae bacterium]|jgi:hypothetical protein|nr:hypothetical protein [Chitinophagaceae bacterium]